MKIDGSKNTLDSQNGKAYKARRKGFQAKQKYADGPFLRVYYYVRPAVKQKNRPREFPKGGIAWCTLCTGGEGVVLGDEVQQICCLFFKRWVYLHTAEFLIDVCYAALE